MDCFIGFDSAWTDNKKQPGAICGLHVDGDRAVRFFAPKLATFEQAFDFISCKRAEYTLVAIDQPTIVRNETSMRPVERVVASVISWLGGGVQPSNTNRQGMFCSNAPIWKFIGRLRKEFLAQEIPELSRTAESGMFYCEVFPALALASLDPQFFGPRRAPRYNPARRKTFTITHWQNVAHAAAVAFDELGASEAANWCRDQAKIEAPKKADQDLLDSALCLVVALRWRRRLRDESIMIGDLNDGYIIAPVTPGVRARLVEVAGKAGAMVDGKIVDSRA